MLEVLTAENHAEAKRYLQAHPYETMLLWTLIDSDRITRRPHDICLLARDTEGRIVGVAYFGLQLVFMAEDETVIRHFAVRAQRYSRSTMILGPSDGMRIFWNAIRKWHQPPSNVRFNQRLYALDRPTLRGSRYDADVAPALLREWDELARYSALMIEQETGFRVDARRDSFRERVRRIIIAGHWWRWRVDEALHFSCNASMRNAQVVQIEEVWTPPHLRGNGYAKRALGAICDHVLDEAPHICLVVNDFNISAIRVYEALGFQQVGTFATLFF